MPSRAQRLNAQQERVLAMVKAGPVTCRDVAEQLGIRESTARNVLSHLEGRDLIQRAGMRYGRGGRVYVTR